MRAKPMRQTVYIDTTVMSYLTAQPHRDRRVAWEQERTRAWWDGPAGKVDLVAQRGISDEAREGDPETVRLRLKALEAVTLLDPTPASEELAEALLDAGAVARHARYAATHIALAATHGAAFLATWDPHVCNVLMFRRIDRICRDFGQEPPFIRTTESLWGEDYPGPVTMAEIYAAEWEYYEKRERARAEAETRRRAVDEASGRAPAREPSTVP